MVNSSDVMYLLSTVVDNRSVHETPNHDYLTSPGQSNNKVHFCSDFFSPAGLLDGVLGLLFNIAIAILRFHHVSHNVDFSICIGLTGLIPAVAMCNSFAGEMRGLLLLQLGL